MKRRYVVVPAAVAALLASPALAATSPQVGDLGHDISSPQCGTATPTTGVFGVVGVTGGKPFAASSCLQSQVDWAVGLDRAPMLYVNTANPAPTSSFYWPTSGSSDPALCANASVTTDPGCAYDYGWHAAANALAKADALTQGASYVRSLTWWLDVEKLGATGNTWNGDGVSNAADLQGMVDRLRTAGVAEVGIYSSAADWQAVTAASGLASYTRSTSSSYRARWPFAPSYPIEDGPVWAPGAGTSGDAQARCTRQGLTGGELLLEQYADSGIDGDYRCAVPDHVAPTAVMKAPTTLVTTAPKVTVGWSGSDAGSGVASYDVQRQNATYNGALGAWSVLLRRYLTTSASLAAPAHGTTSCWAARARDAAGNLSVLSAKRCSVTPLDDRDLGGSAGWTRTAGASGWFSSSYSSTTRQGATLTKSGLQTAHLVLLAWRCPSCGSLVVMLGSTTYRTVSLASSTSGHVLVEIPRFSERTTSVTLKVTSSGKLVRVDGLATSRV